MLQECGRIAEANKRAQGVDWNPVTYHRLASPHRTWADQIIRKLPIAGSDRILDAGCGTGYMTRLVAQRLTGGSVIAVDVFMPMLQFGLANRGDLRHPRIHVVNADLARLPVKAESIDGIFSNAVFHWILDQQSLLENLFGCLRRGGWLVAQTGGGQNMHSILSDVSELQSAPPFDLYFADWQEPWLFVNKSEMKAGLSAAGFCDIETDLEPRPVIFRDRRTFIEYLREIVLRPHLAKLPSMLRSEFLSKLAERSGRRAIPFQVDYHRLNILARKP